MPPVRTDNAGAQPERTVRNATAGVGRKKKRATKNKKLGLIDRLIPAGKYMCRMVSFNWNIRRALDRGIARLACPSREEEEDLIKGATDQEKEFDRCWDELLKIAPYVADLVVNCNSVDQVEMTLEYSKTTSRSEDNSKFKSGVIKWREWSPALPAGKNGQGFAHPECQRMLCPISVNFADPEAKDEFVLNRNPPATHHVWPRCAYAGYTGDIKNPAKGFLRSGLLNKGALAVIHSPSEAEKLNDEDGGSDRGTRPGFAAIHSITEVSRPFLAYIATLLRYSLTTDVNFRIDGPFNYGQYYKDILQYLEEPAFKDTTDELVDWWNRQIFPDEEYARRNPDLSNSNMVEIIRARLNNDNEEGSEGESEFREEPLK